MLKKRPSGSLRTKLKDPCIELNLPKVRTSVAAPAKQYLEVFCSAKTHKPDIPFRTFVSESGCWQKHLALFLQRQLSSSLPSQPFGTRNSQELISAILPHHVSAPEIAFFSMDIEDMYYNLDNPHLTVLKRQSLNTDYAISKTLPGYSFQDSLTFFSYT